MWVKEVIDQMRTAFIIAYVRESEKALLVAVSTKEITADHERRNLIEQHSKQYSYQFNSTILFTVA